MTISPPLCSRTIKEKRDAYVRRLNEIYENNVKKVRMRLSRELSREAGSAGFLATFPALTGVLFSDCTSSGSVSWLAHPLLLLTT